MPEGPEIRRAADALAEAVVGKPLRSVHFAPPALQPYEDELVGQCIESITPHGKALLIRFDGGLTMYSHNQLYGIWKVAAAGKRPTTTRSLRVAFETDDKAILLYSATDISIWPTKEVHTHPFLAGLGPDVLDESLAPADVAERLRDPRFAGRGLPALLLQQAFLAGMGNYLRSEVLFRAKIAPQQRPRDLGKRQITALSKALLVVPRESYRSRNKRGAHGAVTRTADTFRFRVFDRAGLPCETCGTPIEREELAGRRLYWCPHCQA